MTWSFGANRNDTKVLIKSPFLSLALNGFNTFSKTYGVKEQ